VADVDHLSLDPRLVVAEFDQRIVAVAACGFSMDERTGFC